MVRVCGVEESKHAGKYFRSQKNMEPSVRRVCPHRSRALLLVCEKEGWGGLGQPRYMNVGSGDEGPERCPRRL